MNTKSLFIATDHNQSKHITCVFLLTLALLSILGRIEAQNVSEKRVPVNRIPHKYKLVDIRQNPVSKEAYHIYSWVKPIRIARDGYTFDSVTGRHIIVTENGNQVLLNKHEQFVCFAGNKLFTMFPDYEDVSAKIQRSVVSRSKRTVLISKRVTGYVAQLLNVGKNISTTDEGEGGGGTSFYIYSQDLKLLTRYQPFEGWYKDIAQDSDEKRTVVAASSEGNGQKIAVFDNTGKKRKEATLSIPGQFRVSNVYLVREYILVYGGQYERNEPRGELICLNNQLKVAWSKPINFPYNYRDLGVFGLSSPGRIFFLASAADGSDDLVCMELSSGEVVWKKSLSALYEGEARKPLAPVTKTNIGLRPAAMAVNEKMRSVFLVLGNMVWDGNNNDTFRYEASCLFVFDENGKTIKVLDYSSSSKMVKIMSQIGAIKVVDNQKILRYEAVTKK